MDRSLEPNLRSLIPAHNGDLPQELVQLARSLLAQSRGRVLKQEEEVARTYVCAHIACQRLKQHLNLPQILSRPPCPPRVYKKLYEFFDTTLAASGAQQPGTPSRSKKNPKPSSPLQRTPVKTTTKAATPLKRATCSRKDVTGDNEPEWTMQAIRQLCKAFHTPNAAPHVYAGVASVIKLFESDAVSGANTTSVLGSALDPARFPAILITLFLYVKTRMLSEHLTTESFAQDKAKAIQILIKQGQGGSQSQEDISSEITQLTRKERRWQEMDWFANIPIEVDEQGNEYQSDVSADREQGEEPSARDRANLKRRKVMAHPGEDDNFQIGLGTMMQDKIDWCSEERRRDYIEWKAKIMSRIEAIERSRNIGESMDTDT